jgi:hypothetical protein
LKWHTFANWHTMLPAILRNTAQKRINIQPAGFYFLTPCAWLK